MYDNFDKIKYVHLIDQISLRNLDERRQAKTIADILETFFDPIITKDSPLFVNEDYVNPNRRLTGDYINEYKLSARQFYCRGAILNNIEHHKLLDAYYEFIDYILDYDDAHNNRFYRNEIEAILEPYTELKKAASKTAEAD